MKKFNSVVAAICASVSLLLGFFSLIVGVIGYFLADENYMYEVGCGMDFICTISHVYYTTHPFLVGIFGLLGAASIIWMGSKVDAKLEKQSSVS